MMLFSGVMMFIAAIQGKGNDVYSLPILITYLGTILALWGVYRLGYIKSHFDESGKNLEKSVKRKTMFMQIIEILTRKIEDIDSTIREKEVLLTDLEAYKKSLIFEVVTGKRRVC